MTEAQKAAQAAAKAAAEAAAEAKEGPSSETELVAITEAQVKAADTAKAELALVEATIQSLDSVKDKLGEESYTALAAPHVANAEQLREIIAVPADITDLRDAQATTDSFAAAVAAKLARKGGTISIVVLPGGNYRVTVSSSVGVVRKSGTSTKASKGGSGCTVNGTHYPSAAEAARALGIYSDGKDWHKGLLTESNKAGSPVVTYVRDEA